MEEKKQKQVSPTWVFIISGVLIALIGPLCFYLGMQLEKDDNEGTNNNVVSNQTINNTTTNDKYKVYNVGDVITLKDGSKWNVLTATSQDEEFITLLNTENINSDFTIKYYDATSYLNNTYKSKLEKYLSTEVLVVRLLSLSDISKLSGMPVSELVAGVSIKNSTTPSFLYSSSTITDTIDVGCPVMVGSDGSIFVGTQTYTFEIRPVITISKSAIK